MTDTPRRCRVLLADDDETILGALRGLLEEFGFDVVGTAPDGVAAVSLAETLRPDVMLADLRMPHLTGFEVAAALQESCPDVPVIILSAYDDAGLQLAAELIPVAGYLVKGCSSREIFAAIHNAVPGAPLAMPALLTSRD
jgi:DNA-binding NarL/FixJ family response regulator